MDIRVRQVEREATVLALPAGAVVAVADERLRKPEGKPLLPDAGGSVEEKAGGERTALQGMQQPLAQRVVTVERDDGHGRSIARSRRAVT